MNTILEDIAAEIGFTATFKLVIWFGGRRTNIYVPEQPRKGQVLVSIIGLPAATLLSRRWPGRHLNVPTLHAFEVEVRRQEVHRLLSQGATVQETATSVGLTPRRVGQIEAELREAGLLGDPAAAGLGDQAPAMVLTEAAVGGQHEVLRMALADRRRNPKLNGRTLPPRGQRAARN